MVWSAETLPQESQFRLPSVTHQDEEVRVQEMVIEQELVYGIH
jgi:hypothetical protein